MSPGLIKVYAYLIGIDIKRYDDLLSVTPAAREARSLPPCGGEWERG
jgi:hypothetical protein